MKGPVPLGPAHIFNYRPKGKRNFNFGRLWIKISTTSSKLNGYIPVADLTVAALPALACLTQDVLTIRGSK
jgi:hypothetical protein